MSDPVSWLAEVVLIHDTWLATVLRLGTAAGSAVMASLLIVIYRSGATGRMPVMAAAGAVGMYLGVVLSQTMAVVLLPAHVTVPTIVFAVAVACSLAGTLKVVRVGVWHRGR